MIMIPPGARRFFRLKNAGEATVNGELLSLSRKIAVKEGGSIAETLRLKVLVDGSPPPTLILESSATDLSKFTIKIPGNMGPSALFKTIYITGLVGEALLGVLATQVVASAAASGASGGAIALGAFSAIAISALTAIIWSDWVKTIKSNYNQLANVLETALKMFTPKSIIEKF